LTFDSPSPHPYTPAGNEARDPFIRFGDAMALEGYDLMMLGILAAAAVLGYFKGFVWQVAWIAGIAASAFVAVRFAGTVAPFVGQQPPWDRLLAMLLIYMATSMVVWLLFRVVSGAIDAVHMSAFDHQLGLLFGFAKGSLLCVVITFFAVTLAPGFRGQILGSHSGRIVADLITRADEYLPPDIVETVEPFVKQFEDRLRDGGAAAGAPAGPSPLAAIWDGVGSAAAWTGGQGGPAAQPAAAASTWNQPRMAQQLPASAPAQPAVTQPAAQRAAGPPAAGPPAASGFTNGFAPPPQPGFAPPPTGLPPQPFPIGAQSPLPVR
jgi:membrane protein required for colicin V production